MLDSKKVPSVIKLTLLRGGGEVSTREVLTARPQCDSKYHKGPVFYSIFSLLVRVLYCDFHFCQAKEDIFYHNGFVSSAYRPTQNRVLQVRELYLGHHFIRTSVYIKQCILSTLY